MTWAGIGRVLAELRADAGLRQSDIARKIGVSRAHISRIEKGHVSPSPALAERWARACSQQLIFAFESQDASRTSAWLSRGAAEAARVIDDHPGGADLLELLAHLVGENDADGTVAMLIAMLDAMVAARRQRNASEGERAV